MIAEKRKLFFSFLFTESPVAQCHQVHAATTLLTKFGSSPLAKIGVGHGPAGSSLPNLFERYVLRPRSCMFKVESCVPLYS